MTDTTDAILRFQTALEQATTQTCAFDALCALTKDTVGAKLFTVMTADMDAMLARRVYTDDTENYPTSGTKEITLNTWFDQVHGRQECFVANTLLDIDAVFPDAELIGRLGCASVVNLPIIIGGKMVATVNILHEQGYYTPERVAEVKTKLTLPSIATMAIVRQML